jgi:hypothetical protein
MLNAKNSIKESQGSKIIMAIIFAGLSIISCQFAQAQTTTAESSAVIEDLRVIENTQIRHGLVSDNYFQYIKGHIPILISAPHGAIHCRSTGNDWKKSDAYTSSLAIELAHLTGAHVLYVKSKTQEDPNHQVRCRYKDMLARIVEQNGIRFVMDIHGADENRPFKIDVGVMDSRRELSSCPTFMPIIEESFHDFDEVVFNKHFPAKGAGTVTHFARKTLGVESAQFEINALYRIPVVAAFPGDSVRSENILNLLQRMKTMIFRINERVAREAAPSLHSLAKLP